MRRNAARRGAWDASDSRPHHSGAELGIEHLLPGDKLERVRVGRVLSLDEHGADCEANEAKFVERRRASAYTARPSP